MARVYIVSFDDRRPSKFIVLADNMRSAINTAAIVSVSLPLAKLRNKGSNMIKIGFQFSGLLRREREQNVRSIRIDHSYNRSPDCRNVPF